MIATMISSGKRIMVNPETLEIKNSREDNFRYNSAGMYVIEEDGDVYFDEDYKIDPIKDVKKGDVVFLSYPIGGKRYACVVRNDALIEHVNTVKKALDVEYDKRRDTDEAGSPAC